MDVVLIGIIIVLVIIILWLVWAASLIHATITRTSNPASAGRRAENTMKAEVFVETYRHRKRREGEAPVKGDAL